MFWVTAEGSVRRSWRLWLQIFLAQRPARNWGQNSSLGGLLALLATPDLHPAEPAGQTRRMCLSVHIHVNIYPAEQIWFAHSSRNDADLQDQSVSALHTLICGVESHRRTFTYYFLPLHPSVLVPGFDLQLTQAQRFSQIYSVVDIKRQRQTLTEDISSCEKARICSWPRSLFSR